jgi:hypothetical protein
MLSFQGEEELIYYMRLESLWILINIAYGEIEVVELMLIEEPNLSEGVYYTLNEGLIDICRKIMEQIVEEECEDLKTLNLVFQLLTNLCITSPEICINVVNNTIVVEALLKVTQTSDTIQADLYDSMLQCIKIILKVCELSIETKSCFLDIATNCLRVASSIDCQFLNSCFIIKHIVGNNSTLISSAC